MAGEDFDVAVVGGGFAGLACALALADAGASAVVLEARDRVGGRVDRRTLAGGATLDLGGAWAGPTQTSVVALSDRLGVGRYDQFHDGRNSIDLNGRLSTYKGAIPRLGMGALLDMGRMQFGIGRAAKKVAAEQPWAARKASEWDSRSLEDWMLARRHGSTARSLMAIAGRTIWGAEPREMSLLYVLAYIAGAGGLDPLVDTEEGGQKWRFEGGALGLAESLAETLPDGSIRFGHAVEQVAEDEGGVTIAGAGPSGPFEVRAAHAVVAVPLPLRERISFTPELPVAARAAASSWRMGNLTKTFAVYEEPFWRADGLTGEGLTDSGPAALTFDVSPRDGSCGILLGFAGGDDARNLAKLGEAEGRAAVLKGHSRLYGDKALEPVEWLTQPWALEQWSGGGPVAIAPPGALTAAGPALRAPVGRVHWAGSEISPVWGGFIDGAIRSGVAASEQIAAA